MVCGAVAVLVVAGCASAAKSPSPVPATVASRACSAQPPGCGSAQATTQSLAGFTWSAAPAPPLSPRFAQASVWTGTEFLIWGGVQDNQGQPEAGDGAAYDPVTRVWTPMPASPLSPRNTAFAVWTGTRALFWGGGNGSVPLMDGASYDPASRTWAMLPAAPLRPDFRQAIVWTGTQMIVIQPEGGAVFDPAANSWTTVPALPQVAGWEPFAVGAEWTGSEVIAWVASRSPANGLSYSAYSWWPGRMVQVWPPPPGQAWTSLPGLPNVGASPFGTAAPIGGRLLFLGGSGCPPGAFCPAQDFFDGAWFDPSSGTWTSLPVKFSGGDGPAVWTGSAMVVFATKAGASIRPPDIPAGAAAAFDPSTGTWTGLAPCPISDLTNASLTWTGRQLIVVTMNDESGDTPQTEVLSRPIRNST
jgi:hypothetical protein